MMQEQDYIEKLQNKMAERLPEKRFLHTVGVRYTAQALAMRYGISTSQAGIAGVLHDCAKYMTGEKMREKCEKHQISITETEWHNPQLLHAKLGAYYATHRHGVTDAQVISAIRWHTTGKEAMSPLECIVFMADYIEPHRKQIPGLEEIRRVAFVDLEEAVYLTLKNTVAYLEGQDKDLPEKRYDPQTKAAYAYYEARHIKRASWS